MQRAAEIGGHFLDEGVALGMDGGGIERMRAGGDAEEPRGLFEGFVAKAWHLFQCLARREGAVRGAVGDDVFSERSIEAGNVLQQFFRGGVELDTDGIHGADDGVIERGFERALIDIVLVLSDADGFRIDLHQLGERVHESAADADRAAHGEIEIRKFFSCHIRGRVNRSTRFINHHDGDGGGEIELAAETF